MRYWLVFLSLISLAASVHAQDAWVNIAIDDIDSELVLHEPRLVCRFHVSNTMIYPYTVYTDMNSGGAKLLLQQYGRSFTITGRSDSIGMFNVNIKSGILDVENHDVGWNSFSINLRVRSDTAVRVLNAPLDVTLIPNYSKHTWDAQWTAKLINNTRDSVYFKAFRLIGRGADSSGWSIRRNGVDAVPFGVGPFADTQTLALEIHKRTGLPYNESRDTIAIEIDASVNGRDTSISSQIYLRQLQPTQLAVTLVGDTLRPLHSVRNIPVYDTLRFTKPKMASYVGPIKLPQWLTIAVLSESDTTIALQARALTPYRALLRSRQRFTFNSQNFVYGTHIDTVLADIRLTTIERTSMKWMSHDVPQLLVPEPYRLANNGWVLFPIKDGGFYYTSDFGATWVRIATPWPVSAAIRLGNGSLLAHAQDSLVYLSTNRGDTWSCVSDSLDNLRFRYGNYDYWTPTRTRVLLAQQGTIARIQAGYFIEGNAHSLQPWNMYAGSEDGVNWSVSNTQGFAFHPFYLDSSGYFYEPDSVQTWHRDDPPLHYTVLAMGQQKGPLMYGLRGGGVYTDDVDGTMPASFMYGDISLIAASKGRDVFASDTKSLWHYSATEDWVQEQLPDTTERIRNVFFDQYDHLNVLTDVKWYRSVDSYESVTLAQRPAGEEIVPINWIGNEIEAEVRGTRGTAVVRLMDVLGRALSEITAMSVEGGMRVKLEVPNLPHGQYFLTVQSAAGSGVVGIAK